MTTRDPCAATACPSKVAVLAPVAFHSNFDDWFGAMTAGIAVNERVGAGTVVTVIFCAPCRSWIHAIF